MSHCKARDMDVRIVDAEKIALEFVEYMSIDDRPYAHESEYLQFQRWIKRTHPDSSFLAASIWAWNLL